MGREYSTAHCCCAPFIQVLTTEQEGALANPDSIQLFLVWV